jgi:hypothetical protein
MTFNAKVIGQKPADDCCQDRRWLRAWVKLENLTSAAQEAYGERASDKLVQERDMQERSDITVVGGWNTAACCVLAPKSRCTIRVYVWMLKFPVNVYAGRHVLLTSRKKVNKQVFE